MPTTPGDPDALIRELAARPGVAGLTVTGTTPLPINGEGSDSPINGEGSDHLRRARPSGPTEAEFQKQVIDLARLRGFRVAHFRPGRVARKGKEKYETAVAADGRGWPDLVMIHPTRRGDQLRLIVAELKVGRNTLSEAQKRWLAMFNAVGVYAVVWTPKDWPEIERVFAENA